MTPRREDVKQRVSSSDMRSQKRTTDQFISFPAFCILKAHDRIDDSALAVEVKVPVKTVSSETLKFDANEEQLDDKLPEQPATFSKRITNSRGPSTKVTECSTNEGDGTNYCIYLRSEMKTDSSHKIQPATDPAERPVFDKKTRVSSERALSERSVPRREPKPEITRCSFPDGELARPDRADLKIDILLKSFPEMKGPLPQITIKKSLDPLEILSSLKKPLRKRRICPASYQPVRPAAENVCNDFLPTKPSPSEAKSLSIEICVMPKRLDQQLQRLASEQALRTEIKRIKSAKSDKVCRRSAEVFKRACFIPEISEETLCLPCSKDSLAGYKKFSIPAYQLDKYEVGRSKRNGLQDESSPLVRTILQTEEQRLLLDKCIERERKIDQTRTELLLYVK